MRNVTVVPHTHWDREWYFTIEDSNNMLIEHMDYLIEFLLSHKEYPCFTFDGQVSVVEDYLQVRPENREVLENLVRDKRIFIGPWYTQCDTLNCKLESVIRNLQFGIGIASTFGHSMNIGYLPDVFGQNAYMPSVFVDCEIDYSIVQRGIGNDQIKDGINFNWEAPNGKIIKSNYIYFGYGPGKFLSSETEYVEKNLLPIVEKLASFDENNILLPSGGDQALIRTQFNEVVNQLNQDIDGYRFSLGSYESFMENINFTNTIEGELYECQKSRIHRTIHSQRVDIKSENNKVEKLIIEEYEPLVAYLKLFGVDYPDNWQKKIWTQLFDVHSHDSLGGCNSDDTNYIILNRLNSIERMVKGQINIIKRKIAKIVNQSNDEVILYNFTQSENKVFYLDVFSNTKCIKLEHPSINQQVLLSQEKIDGGSKVVLTSKGEEQVKLPDYYQNSIAVELNSVGIGATKLKIVNGNPMEEKNYNVRDEYIYPGMKISFIDGLFINNHQILVTVETDGGDSYDYSPIKNHVLNKYDDFKVTSFKQNNIFDTIEAKITVKYAESLTSETLISQDITLVLKVNKSSNQIEVNLITVNKLKDARIRLLITDVVKKSEHLADSGMGLIKRKNQNNTTGWVKEYVEKPELVYPFERLIVGDELVLSNSNAKEYQIIENDLYLTLYRSVGLLGRDNLVNRPNRASGINNRQVFTPDAQLYNKEITIDFVISFNYNDPYKAYFRNVCDNQYYQVQDLNNYHHRLDRFELAPVKKNMPLMESICKFNKGLEVSSIRNYKNNFEIRVFNTTKETIKIDLSSKYNYYFVNLLSNRVDEVESVKPYDYITIRLELNNE